ncbi:efflux transporter outer membrane subunit [Sphingomonas jatrophae]|uniref:Outer membrane protein, multidrug efflux system n=1 Tax=Sphingomonas jatrophae TaxID=1166337 RepID=A0A1I6JIW4_9SPHN|nr:efflux transporter outer membrane subunit [Sphingomonas jatrophae]SFR78819.1 outer membrane protein, multidrug efflux system [Sphingomonas jatrophae]
MSRRITLLLAAAALTSCTMEPKLERPALPVPPSWPVGDAYLRQQEAALPSVSWRAVFRDQRLQRIVEQALANNRDLRIAAANIASARALYRIQRADLFPEVGVTGSFTRARSGGATSIRTGGGLGSGTGVGTGTGVGNGGVGTGTGTGGTGTGAGTGTGTGVGAGTGGGVVSTGGSSRSVYSLQGGITNWEIDLFGRIRSLTDAAQRRYFGQEAAARATRLTLVGDLADAWLTYAADRTLMRIAEDTARSAEDSVRLTRARLNGGVAPRTDLRQAEQILATAQADLATQRTALAQDANLLQLLVGAPVDPALLPASIEEAAATVGELPAGLDSTILLRRPDVVQAEYELRAVNAEIGAARAALFPTISLTGVLGFASTALSSMFSSDSFSWSVSPQARYSIFRAGAGVANVRYSEAQRDAALATYERAVQSAFREVSDALARRGTIADELAAQRRFRDAALDTFQLTQARYRGGIDTFLSSLDAQRSLYSAQRTLASTELTRASNLVSLYRTLGGDQTLDATPGGPVPLSPEDPPRSAPQR